MIDWNAVKVGETEIISPRNEKWLVVGVHNLTAWLFNDGVYYQIRTGGTSKWTIYDPWEEITNNCQWVRCTDTDTLWVVYHDNQVIYHNDQRYRIDAPRIWKRKEG